MEHDHEPFVEDPDAFPSWVYQYTSTPEYEFVNNLRGVPMFKMMEEVGFHVTGWDMESPSFEIQFRGAWTHVFLMAPPYDDLTKVQQGWECRNASIIIDCHFPIVDMTHVAAPDADFMRIIEHRDVMLNNLRLAEAVTTPRAEWAADLAQFNPNVFILPDLDLHDGDSDRVAGEKLIRFQVRFASAANAALKEHTARHYAKYGTYGSHPHAPATG